MCWRHWSAGAEPRRQPPRACARSQWTSGRRTTDCAPSCATNSGTTRADIAAEAERLAAEHKVIATVEVPARTRTARKRGGEFPDHQPLVRTVCEPLAPIAEELRREVMASAVIQTDDTPVALAQLVGQHGSRHAREGVYLNRDGLAAEVDSSLPAKRVIRSLEEVAPGRGYPKRISVDNGPEFRSRALDAWAYVHGVILDLIEPGKPIQNTITDSYNGRIRDELLDLHWWNTVAEAPLVVAAHRIDYNEVRPRGALGNTNPSEFARRYAENINPQRLASSNGPTVGGRSIPQAAGPRDTMGAQRKRIS